MGYGISLMNTFNMSEKNTIIILFSNVVLIKIDQIVCENKQSEQFVQIIIEQTLQFAQFAQFAEFALFAQFEQFAPFAQFE